MPPGINSVTPICPRVSAACARVKPTTPNFDAQYAVASPTALMPRVEATVTVVTVASTLGIKAVGDATAYCASKFGVVGFTRAQAAETRGQIGVTLLIPGGMHSAFFDGRDEQYRPPPDAQSRYSSVQVLVESQRPARVPQLRQRLGLDLPDALPGDAELLAHLLQRAGVAVTEAVPQPDDSLLAIGQAVQDGVELLLQQQERGRVNRHHRVGVLDEGAEVGVFIATDRRLQRHWLLSDLLKFEHLRSRQPQLASDLFGRWLATQLPEQLALHPRQLVDRLDQVHRDPDSPGLVRDRPRDRLPDPPGGVRRELVGRAAAVPGRRTTSPSVDAIETTRRRLASTRRFLASSPAFATVSTSRRTCSGSRPPARPAAAASRSPANNPASIR